MRGEGGFAEGRERVAEILLVRHAIEPLRRNSQTLRRNASSNRVGARSRTLRREYFERIAVKENPGNIGKNAPDQRQIENVRREELHKKTRLAGEAFLPEGVDDMGEPLFHLLGRRRTMERRAQDVADRRSFGDHDMRGIRRQRLTEQSRAAARHVEDEAGGFQARRQAGGGVGRWNSWLKGRVNAHTIVS